MRRRRRCTRGTRAAACHRGHISPLRPACVRAGGASGGPAGTNSQAPCVLAKGLGLSTYPGIESARVQMACRRVHNELQRPTWVPTCQLVPLMWVLRARVKARAGQQAPWERLPPMSCLLHLPLLPTAQAAGTCHACSCDPHPCGTTRSAHTRVTVATALCCSHLLVFILCCVVAVAAPVHLRCKAASCMRHVSTVARCAGFRLPPFIFL